MTSIHLKSLLYRNLVLLVFVPLLVLILVIMAIHSADIRRNINVENQDILSTISAEIISDLKEPLNQLLLVREMYLDHSSMLNGKMDSFLQSVVGNSPVFESVSIANRDGRVIAVGLSAAIKAGRDEFLGQDLSHSEFFQQVSRSGQPFWSDTYTSTYTGNPVLTLAVPAGKSIVVGNLNLGCLKTITGRIMGERRMSIAILNRRGVAIGHANHEYVNQQADFSNLDIVRQSMRGNQGSYRFVFKGRERIGSITTIPDTSWMVMVSQDAQIAYRPIYRLGIIFLSGLILSASFVMFAASRSIARILKPISTLMESTRAIAAGRYLDFKPAYSIHEIDELGKDFRAMAVSIQAREFELHERNDELMSLEEELRQQLDENFQYQEDLISAAERLEMILASIGDGFCAADSNGHFTYFNKVAERLLGRERDSVIGKQVWEVLPETVGSVFQLEYQKAMSSRQPVSFTAFYAPTGFWLEAHYYPFEDGLTVFFRDVSEMKANIIQRKSLEEQLLHAQRMESVGTLAGGIAHDFNNILTVIIGCSNMAQRHLTGNPEAERYVNQVLEAANRAAGLTQNLLTFSRKQVIDMASVNLNHIVSQLEHLLRRIIREDISMEFDLCDSPLNIMADSGQLDQVIINLVANARDAMPNGGSLHISTSREWTLMQFPENNEPTETYCAVLKVADTGTGMDSQTMERIFDPFYTTKDIGKGTGLGLAMAYGIISQHQGLINVSSEPGRGTVFTVYLPLTTVTDRVVIPANFIMSLRGDESILLAEDDPYVRDATSAILEYAGYNVITAVNGQEAVSCFENSSGKIDLVLMDVIMPVMNGMDAYFHIRQLRPDIRIIFTSGYTADILQHEGVNSADIRLLQKPVSPDMLLATIREMLDAPAEQSPAP